MPARLIALALPSPCRLPLGYYYDGSPWMLGSRVEDLVRSAGAQYRDWCEGGGGALGHSLHTSHPALPPLTTPTMRLA